MNKSILPALCAVLLLASCQKEVSVDLGGTGGTGGTTTGDLLSKITSVNGTDTYSVEYQYDASKRVIREITSGVSAGQDVSNDLRFVRNASGIITTVIQKTPALPDSAVTRVNYNTGTGRYTSKISEFVVSGITVTDSTAFVYDGSGKLIQEDDYLGNSLLGVAPFLAQKTQYTFDASGNVASYKFISVDPTGGPDSTLAQVAITYDTKSNPLKLSYGEAALLGDLSFSSTNNPLKYSYTDVANAGAASFVLDFTYTYNTKNKPATSSYKETPGGAVVNNTYTYK